MNVVYVLEFHRIYDGWYTFASSTYIVSGLMLIFGASFGQVSRS